MLHLNNKSGLLATRGTCYSFNQFNLKQESGFGRIVTVSQWKFRGWIQTVLDLLEFDFLTLWFSYFNIQI